MKIVEITKFNGVVKKFEGVSGIQNHIMQSLFWVKFELGGYAEFHNGSVAKLVVDGKEVEL